MSNVIKFEILGINIPAISEVNYYDEGFVDIPTKISGLYDRYSIAKDSKYYEDINESKLVYGTCREVLIEGNIKYKNLHIFYSEKRLSNRSGVLAISTRAHEETHALDIIGQITALEDRLLEEQRVRVDLKSENSEVRAIIGGHYAITSRKLNTFSSFAIIMKLMTDKDYKKAIDVYYKSKIPKKEYYSTGDARNPI